jgi:hypothetical protein
MSLLGSGFVGGWHGKTGAVIRWTWKVLWMEVGSLSILLMAGTKVYLQLPVGYPHLLRKAQVDSCQD